MGLTKEEFSGEVQELVKAMLRDVIGNTEKHSAKCAEYRKNSQTSICLCYVKTRNLLRLEQIERAKENWGIKV